MNNFNNIQIGSTIETAKGFKGIVSEILNYPYGIIVNFNTSSGNTTKIYYNENTNGPKWKIVNVYPIDEHKDMLYDETTDTVTCLTVQALIDIHNDNILDPTTELTGWDLQLLINNHSKFNIVDKQALLNKYATRIIKY